MLADSADFPITVAEIVASLQKDPILVEETMGSGHTDQVRSRLAHVAATLPFPAYVVLVDQPRDVTSGSHSAEYLATAVHNRLKKPGLYLVETSEDRALAASAYGVDLDPSDYSNQASSNRERLMDRMAAEQSDSQVYLAPGVDAEIGMLTATYPLHSPDGSFPGPSNLPDKVADDLMHEQGGLMEQNTTGDYADQPGNRTSAAAGVGLGLFLTIVLSTLTWVLVKRRMAPAGVASTTAAAASPPTPSSPQTRPTKAPKRRITSLQSPMIPAEVDWARQYAENALAALSGRISHLPSPTPRPDHEQRALLAHDAADLLLRDEKASAGPILGAIVLIRTADREVSRATGEELSAYRPCFFDPLHGEADATASWKYGEGEATVPVCHTCAKTVAGGGRPHSRRLVAHVPYYEGKDVWARTGFGALTDDLAGDVLRDRQGRDR